MQESISRLLCRILKTVSKFVGIGDFKSGMLTHEGIAGTKFFTVEFFSGDTDVAPECLQEVRCRDLMLGQPLTFAVVVLKPLQEQIIIVSIFHVCEHRDTHPYQVL